ncbi:MAG: UDP-N-acetylmuramate dehydrogenase [Firmicutes bacterium]|nr:UDP-N-acetylmuramate dehydrogenase [Bacillota bacterium]
MSEIKLNITENYPLSSCTTFRCGGPADRLVTVNSKDELLKAMELPRPMILGNGSNVLFPDSGYRGTIIKFGPKLSRISVRGKILRAGAGASFAAAAKAACANGLTGLEFATGIPGSVGGAVYMNAGAYDGCVADTLFQVKSIPEVKDFGLSYRHSAFMDCGAIILEAAFRLKEGVQADIDAKVADPTARRKEKQPLQYPSAGSFFKRPEGYFAGKLIQDAGLKGASVGGAQVSELHAGFIINKGGATSSDVLALMKLVQDTVFDKFGVMLQPEVRIIE